MQAAPDTTNRDSRRATESPAATAFAFTIANTCRMAGFRPTTAYKLIKEGHLRTLRVGRRRLVTGESLRGYLKSLGADLAQDAA